MYVTVCVLENDQKVFPWTMLLCSEEHTFAKLLENVKERVPGSNFRGRCNNLHCVSVDRLYTTCQLVLDGKVSTVCFSKASITIFRAEVVIKIVVCFERLNFEKSVRLVDKKQDISLLWPKACDFEILITRSAI